MMDAPKPPEHVELVQDDPRENVVPRIAVDRIQREKERHWDQERRDLLDGDLTIEEQLDKLAEWWYRKQKEDPSFDPRELGPTLNIY